MSPVLKRGLAILTLLSVTGCSSYRTFQPLDLSTAGTFTTYCVLPLMHAMDWLAQQSGQGYGPAILAIAIGRWLVGLAGIAMSRSVDKRKLATLGSQPPPDVGGAPQSSEPANDADAMDPKRTKWSQGGAKGCFVSILSLVLSLGFFAALWLAFLHNPHLANANFLGFPLLGTPDWRLVGLAVLTSGLALRVNPAFQGDNAETPGLSTLRPWMIFGGAAIQLGMTWALVPPALTVYSIAQDLLRTMQSLTSRSRQYLKRPR